MYLSSIAEIPTNWKCHFNNIAYFCQVISHLSLQHWRNHDQLDLELQSGLTQIVGMNGSGKTSILEALTWLSMLRSWKTSKRQECITHGQNTTSISTTLTTGQQLKCGFSATQMRLQLSGINVSTLEYLMRNPLRTTLYSPEDLDTWRLSPALRRRWLGKVVIDENPEHLTLLSEYQQLLRQRNALLKQRNNHQLLDIYDQHLAQRGQAIILARRNVITTLQQQLSSTQQELQVRQNLTLAYHPDISSSDTSEYEQILIATRDRDTLLQSTQRGPHRDQILLMLDGTEARIAASRGELRLAVLALKLAELRHASRTDRVLLLDDVFAELDPLRREYVSTVLTQEGIQCLMTATEPLAGYGQILQL